MIICASALLAAQFCSRYKEHCRTLDELCSMLLRIGAEIRRCKTPLAGLLKSSGASGDFAKCCIGKMENGAGFHTAWISSSQELAQRGLLTDEEAQALRSIGEQLGKGDVREQLTLIESSREYFLDRAGCAREERTAKSRTAASCCVLGGVLLAVLLI